MENFTPVSAIIGGLFIGTAATLMLWANGRIAGISGILSGILLPTKNDFLWRLLFVAGLLTGPLIYLLAMGSSIDISIQASPTITIIAGLLVGFGTRLGSGCTSGHGICGLARFSSRSFLATTTFIAAAILTVFITRHLIGLQP